ncbi:uncharacterized protein LOC124175043 [Neodiprion fabricii]|uniref:uncharacterized protein LOC124175043 n=1 Tax=Neodiprion fabricii TaxID=2872261 RepID=UPI001ED9693E|nr:uncharacterized protein LOC124175043 [Neodiprion fabricii]
MALTIALPLSDLEPDHFYALGVRLLYDLGVRALAGVAPAPISPSSGSESSGFSSGFSSLATSTGFSTPAESRPTTPEDIQPLLNLLRPLQCLVVSPPTTTIAYGSRDLLDLAGNIRGPGWPILHPNLRRNDHSIFTANSSSYHRLGEHGLIEDYPTRQCQDCSFCEPSPILSF